MKFNPWPKEAESEGEPFKRFYTYGKSGVYIGDVRGKVVIAGGTPEKRSEVSLFLVKIGVDLENIHKKRIKLADLGVILKDNGCFAKQGGQALYGKGGDKSVGKASSRTSQEIESETSVGVVSSIRFKAASANNGYIIVDNGEPKELFEKISEGKIKNIKYEKLPLGDILIGDDRCDDVLLIERKTITDLSASILSNHAHDQAERMFEERNRLAKLGKKMKVMWLVEGEDGGSRLLYNSLKTHAMVDGWINYLEAILDQSTVQTYNMQHTATLVTRLAQGYIERELTNKVKTGHPLVNRVHSVELLHGAGDEGEDHGVTRSVNGLDAMLSYIPSVKRNVATELSKLGLSFSQVTQMTIGELEKVKGVGKKSAVEIFDDFNKM